MAEQQRQTILQALRAVHAASTSHEDRARAGQYLESFKSSPSGADAAVVFFEKSSCEDVELRHFCLHSINDALKSQWNTWQQNRKDLLKRKIFSFASSHLNDILVGPKVIRETISSLLAELAKREWPQLWPSFCNDIFHQQLCRWMVGASVRVKDVLRSIVTRFERLDHKFLIV